MEIANEAGGPGPDHIWIAGVFAGPGDLGGGGSSQCSSLSLCGRLANPDDSYFAPLNYIWTEWILVREQRVKGFWQWITVTALCVRVGVVLTA